MWPIKEKENSQLLIYWPIFFPMRRYGSLININPFNIKLAKLLNERETFTNSHGLKKINFFKAEGLQNHHFAFICAPFIRKDVFDPLAQTLVVDIGKNLIYIAELGLCVSLKPQFYWL